MADVATQQRPFVQKHVNSILEFMIFDDKVTKVDLGKLEF